MAGGYHLFSSGEVLTAANANNYLMNQTVMVFASAAARTTALSGVLAEGMTSYRTDSHVFEVYNGTAWVASETNLTTKGDLATYDTAPNRLAVGTDGQILMANSGSTPGLAWVGYAPAGKNAIINGGMDIWQRGTSIALSASTGTAAGYSADRWDAITNTNQACVISRQPTGDTTNLPNIQYCARFQRNSGQTGVGTLPFFQNLETTNSIPFSGKQVTLSFYARAGANYSATSNVLAAYLFSGTGTDQNAQSGPTGQVTIVSSNLTLTTTWQRFSITGTVGATATQLFPYFQYTPTGTAGANDYYEVTGVQLELGSTATTFSRAGGSIGGELALCQRYYYRWTANSTFSRYPALSTAVSTTQTMFPSITPVPLRATPSAVEVSSNWRVYDGATAVTGATISIVTSTEAQSQPYLIASVSSGLTQFRPYMVTANNDASAYVGLSAEL